MPRPRRDGVLSSFPTAVNVPWNIRACTEPVVPAAVSPPQIRIWPPEAKVTARVSGLGQVDALGVAVKVVAGGGVGVGGAGVAGALLALGGASGGGCPRCRDPRTASCLPEQGKLQPARMTATVRPAIARVQTDPGAFMTSTTEVYDAASYERRPARLRNASRPHCLRER